MTSHMPCTIATSPEPIAAFNGHKECRFFRIDDDTTSGTVLPKSLESRGSINVAACDHDFLMICWGSRSALVPCSPPSTPIGCDAPASSHGLESFKRAFPLTSSRILEEQPWAPICIPFPRTQLFQTPRVNGAVLGQFVGRTVCVVGKVASYQEGSPEAQLQTSVSRE